MLSKEAARAINRLTREILDILRSSDGSALFDFVEEYLCGDDPDDNEDELSSGKVPFQYKIQLYQTHSGTDVTEDGDLATTGNTLQSQLTTMHVKKLTKSN